MEGKCHRSANCISFEHNGRDGCEGCGFQHFDKILDAHPSNETLKTLGEAYFSLCSTGKRSRGGRITLDKPLRELFKDKFGSDNLPPQKGELTINGEKVLFKAKYDGAFQINGKYIFYEVKGYGDNTNDILSAITAAQLLKTVPAYKNALYYYIGVSSSVHNQGLERGHFVGDPKRTKIYPYVKWAESMGFLKFYGIADIDDLLQDIKEINYGGYRNGL